MTRDEVQTTARLAGQVLRYHTWVAHRQQSVGEHTWQCMRIYWEIWGPLSPEISTYFIWHDAGELVLGDLPYPVKKNNPDLKEICDEVEDRTVENMGGPTNSKGRLTQLEVKRVKLCDLLDMYEFGRTEYYMGNNFASPIMDDIGAELDKLIPQFDAVDQDLVKRYIRKLHKGNGA